MVVRAIVGGGSGARPSANCQSAYSKMFANWSQSGARRGQSGATSY